jgi:hypothetical protein
VATDHSEVVDEVTSVAERLRPAEAGDVLVCGPAMSGKTQMALELLVAAVVETEGRPFYLTTSGSATDARARLDARTPEGGSLPRPAVVACDGGPELDEFTRSVDTPGDLTGLATALTEMYDASRRSRRLGSRVLVDNVTALLVATDLEPVYRFMHALTVRVAEAGGQTIATLDTDGLAGGERPALTGLFDTVVEVRHPDGSDPEYRLHDSGDWHGYLLPGGDR